MSNEPSTKAGQSLLRCDPMPKDALRAAILAIEAEAARPAEGLREAPEAPTVDRVDLMGADAPEAWRMGWRVGYRRALAATPAEGLREAIVEELYRLGTSGETLVRIEEVVAALNSRWSIETRKRELENN